MAEGLLSRDEFRKAVFGRDGYRCVNCKEPAQDAHHIVERRLFSDGGYYVDNGASVCGPCHLRAESTELSCDELREKAGIKRVVLPPQFYGDQPIDKWGNPILPDGRRLRGELFEDESVRKVIQPVLHLFTNRVKYPRTYHLPWSPGVSDDDRIIESLAGLEGEEVVATLKLDGEQMNVYRDGFHARSIDTQSHPCRDWFWAVHRRIGHEIPENWRICGENLYAKHSIHYRNLPGYFIVFGVWNEKNVCLSRDETEEWAALLDLPVVPVLWRGGWNEAVLRALYSPEYEGDPCEGFVVRVARAFHYKEYRHVVAKYVRAGHVQTHAHWLRQALEKNGLKEKAEA